MSSQLLWYTTRATGVVSLIMLTGTVMLGVIGTARAGSERWPRLVTAALHRNLALMSIAIVGVHVLTTVLDPFAPIGWIAAVVPFASPYRPLWLSLGTIAFDLLLAVLITSLLRDRLSRPLWRGVHLLVYLSWPVALWHGLGTGTDTKLTWLLGLDLACVAGVCWAAWWRISLIDNARNKAAGLAAVLAVPVLTLVFVLAGPLRPGWAARAGTPTALLGSHSQPSAAGPGQAAALTNAPFTGTVAKTRGPGTGELTIAISGRTTGAAGITAEPFSIVLHGSPSGDGIALSDGNVQIGQRGAAGSLAGPVVQLTGREVVAAVTGTGGERQARFILNLIGTSATGTVSVLTARE